jgi:hypothetical protein
VFFDFQLQKRVQIIESDDDEEEEEEEEDDRPKKKKKRRTGAAQFILDDVEVASGIGHEIVFHSHLLF